MSGRFVRASKYRHVFGRSTRRDVCYDNLRISKNAWDTNLIKANPKYLAVNWEASGGGAFAVIPLEEKGKLPEQIPLFRGHTAAVLDTDWSPFADDLIASGSDDGKVFLWKVPEGFTLHTDAEEPADVKPVGKLSGHSRKVGHVLFNPAAENVLASSSGDYTVKIWDLEDGRSKLTLKHSDIVQSLSWSADGSMLVTTSRDKKLRFWDVRQEKPAHEVAGHPGAKNSRCVWLGEHDRVATTGFSKMSERQLGLWDVRSPQKPIGGELALLDSSSGVGMPFWDDGCQMLYIAGKGDGNIRYSEFEHDKFEPLSEYKSGEPQRGLAFMPKRGVNTHDNEIMRAYKTVNDMYVEPISFIVPRRAEVFQDDVYPATTGLKSAASSGEWFGGKTGLPPKFSMEDMYEGQEPKEVAAEEVARPSATQSAPESAPAAVAALPTKTGEAPPKPESTPVPTATRELPALEQNKQSMASLAEKFNDEGDGEEDEDASSFEEVQKPVERPSSILVARQEARSSVIEPKQNQTHEPSKTTTAAAPQPEAQARSAPDDKITGEEAIAPATVAVTPTPTADSAKKDEKPAEASTGTASSAAGGLRDVLQEIRTMQQSQGRQMELQGKQLERLLQEFSQLKARVGDLSDRLD